MLSSLIKAPTTLHRQVSSLQPIPAQADHPRILSLSFPRPWPLELVWEQLGSSYVRCAEPTSCRSPTSTCFVLTTLRPLSGLRFPRLGPRVL